MSWRAITDGFAARLAPAGLDLVAPYPDEGALGIVVGNTNAFWGRFGEALRARPGLVAEAHPIHRYVEAAVTAAGAGLGAPHRVHYAHQRPFQPIQRIAERAGLAWLAPSHLAVHPVYGPWISLRAVVTVDVAGPELPPPAPPCAHCDQACLPAFERAMAAADPAKNPDAIRSPETWRLWLAVRDACPSGRAHRFDEEHLRYGYTMDRSILVALASPAR